MSKGVWWRWVYVFLSSCPAEGARQGCLRLSNTTPRQVHPTPALSVWISTPVIFAGLIVAMFTCPSAHLDMGCPMEGFRGFQGTPIMLPLILPPAIFYVHVGFLLLLDKDLHVRVWEGGTQPQGGNYMPDTHLPSHSSTLFSSNAQYSTNVRLDL